MRRKNLTPDKVVERAMKRFDSEPGPLLSNDLEQMISPKIREVIGWKHHPHLFRVRIERANRFQWNYRLEYHLLRALMSYERKSREEEPEAEWAEWEKDYRLVSASSWECSYSWPFFSRKRCVEAAHAKLDKIQKEFENRSENVDDGDDTALLKERPVLCDICRHSVSSQRVDPYDVGGYH